VRIFLTLAIVGAAALSPAANAQESFLDFFPPGTKIGGTKICPDPEEESGQPECCRITVEIDSAGKGTSASATCTHPAYERPAAQCEVGRTFDQRITNDGPVPYKQTFTQTYLAEKPTRETFRRLMVEADRRCDLLK
jgi:hypothetical protein